MRRAVLLALLLPAAPAEAAPFLAGSWFGQGQPYDKTAMFLAHMLPNGDFRAQFRTCTGNKAQDSIETGRWSLSGDLETITISTVNGRFDPRQDTYAILSHTDRKQTYRLVRSGFVYTSNRVGENFKMPDCGLTS